MAGLSLEYLKKLQQGFGGAGQGAMLGMQMKQQEEQSKLQFQRQATLGGAQFTPTPQVSGPPTAKGVFPTAPAIPEGAISGDTEFGQDLGVPKGMYMELPKDFSTTKGVRNWDRADLLTYYKAITSNPLMLLSERGQRLMKELEEKLKTQFSLSSIELQKVRGTKPSKKEKLNLFKRFKDAFKILKGDVPTDSTLTDFIDSFSDDETIDYYR